MAFVASKYFFQSLQVAWDYKVIRGVGFTYIFNLIYGGRVDVHDREGYKKLY